MTNKSIWRIKVKEFSVVETFLYNFEHPAKRCEERKNIFFFINNGVRSSNSIISISLRATKLRVSHLYNKICKCVS